MPLPGSGGGVFPPSSKDRADLAILVTLQYIRTRAVRQDVAKLMDFAFKTHVALQGKDRLRAYYEEQGFTTHRRATRAGVGRLV